LKVLSAHHVAFKQRIGRKSCEIAKNLCQLRFDLVEYTQLPVWRLAKGAFPLAPISTLEKLSMKKTLIALAAVAVAGAASAQVTLSGGFAYGYQSVKDASAGTTAKGFGTDTAAFTMAFSEDLGGGLKLAGQISAGGLARSTGSVGGEDAKVTLSGAFGALTLGSVEIGSGIRGLAQAGAPVNNMEGEVLAGAANFDLVGYGVKMGDVTISASITENGGAPALADGMSTGQGVGTTVGVAYASGAVAAKLDTTSASNAAAGKMDSRYRVSASYDLGMAKVGAGHENQKLVGGGNNKYTMVGLSAPLSSALTVGVVWVKNDTTATAGSKTGSSIGASYAMSKRTSISASYATWEDGEAAGALKDKKTTVLLAHSF
jgi:hypothetical protein